MNLDLKYHDDMVIITFIWQRNVLNLRGKLNDLERKLWSTDNFNFEVFSPKCKIICHFCKTVFSKYDLQFPKGVRRAFVLVQKHLYISGMAEAVSLGQGSE